MKEPSRIGPAIWRAAAPIAPLAPLRRRSTSASHLPRDLKGRRGRRAVVKYCVGETHFDNLR